MSIIPFAHAYWMYYGIIRRNQGNCRCVYHPTPLQCIAHHEWTDSLPYYSLFVFHEIVDLLKMLAAIYEIELKLKSYPTWACYKSVELKCLPLLSANVIAIGFLVLHRSENKKSFKGLEMCVIRSIRNRCYLDLLCIVQCGNTRKELKIREYSKKAGVEWATARMQWFTLIITAARNIMTYNAFNLDQVNIF